jgi:peroxiredoxin Q/BCP
MPLKVQDTAPDFSAPSTAGKNFNLYAELAHSPIVLYFYPNDFTPGCTKEACEFRDHSAAFHDLNVKVIGINKDNIETHKRFRMEHKLPFELVSDESGDIAKAYKALIPLVGLTRRVTYLIGTDKKILASFDDFFGAASHVKEMLKQAK